MTVATKTRSRHLLLRACPRCQGDLMPDLQDDEEFVCLQCSRRFTAQHLAALREAELLAPAA